MASALQDVSALSRVFGAVRHTEGRRAPTKNVLDIHCAKILLAEKFAKIHVSKFVTNLWAAHEFL